MAHSGEGGAAARAATASAHGKRRPILVVSSNQWTVQLVRTLLAGQGLRDVVLALTAEKAREELRSPVDLIIADCGPASIDGLSLVEELRREADPKIAKAAALLLFPESLVAKGACDSHFSERCRKAEIRGIVTKPIVPAKLLDQIARALPQEISGGDSLEPSITSAENPLAGHPILIVSANKFMSQLVRTMLFGGGATGMVIAEDLEAAKQRLSTSSFDLVVADSGPASLDGLGLTEWFRAQRTLKTKPTGPVVLLTSKPSADFVDRARRARVSAIVAKPLIGRVFLNRVIKAVTNVDDAEAARLAEHAEARVPKPTAAAAAAVPPVPQPQPASVVTPSPPANAPSAPQPNADDDDIMIT